MKKREVQITPYRDTPTPCLMMLKWFRDTSTTALVRLVSNNDSTEMKQVFEGRKLFGVRDFHRRAVNYYMQFYDPYIPGDIQLPAFNLIMRPESYIMFKLSPFYPSGGYFLIGGAE